MYCTYMISCYKTTFCTPHMAIKCRCKCFFARHNIEKNRCIEHKSSEENKIVQFRAGELHNPTESMET